MDYVLKRLREPSTMAGLSAIALIAGVPPGTIEVAAQVVGAALAVAAVVFPEARK